MCQHLFISQIRMYKPKLVSAILCRNEKAKYLERVLRRCLEFSEVLVLDDGSTDGSAELAEDLGCVVHRRQGPTAWGAEAPARALLWDLGATLAGDGWLLVCDGDMILMGDPRPLCLSTQVNCWSFVLFDVWNQERFYRCDGLWKGHEHPRPWLFRPSRMGYDRPEWPDRGIHCGHSPINARLVPGIVGPEVLAWRHLSFMKKDDRLLKVQQYKSQAHQLSPFEIAHAESVGD